MTERPRLHLKSLAADEPNPVSNVMPEPADFFLIWTKTGWRPRKAHDSFDAAVSEAERLARQHPGKKFIILKAVAKYHVPLKLTPPVTETV